MSDRVDIKPKLKKRKEFLYVNEYNKFSGIHNGQKYILLQAGILDVIKQTLLDIKGRYILIQLQGLPSSTLIDWASKQINKERCDQNHVLHQRDLLDIYIQLWKTHSTQKHMTFSAKQTTFWVLNQVVTKYKSRKQALLSRQYHSGVNLEVNSKRKFGDINKHMETAKQTIEWSTGPLEKSGRKQNNCNNQVKIKT